MYRSVPKLVHDQNLIFKPINIKLSFSHRIIETLVIILENAISVNKPIMDSGTCSLSRISTHTPKVTIKGNGYIISKNVTNVPREERSLSWTVTVRDRRKAGN